MPRPRDEQQVLHTPKTRVTNQWTMFVRMLTRDNPHRLKNARTWSSRLRHRR